MSKERKGGVTSHSSLVRVFCAIELPYSVREKVAAHILQLRDHAPDVKASWSRPENIHLTLKFIGEVSIERVAPLSQAAASAVSSISPLSLRLEETGSFPSRGAAKVLWLGVTEQTGALLKLHERLDDECEKEGFPREARKFHPHLTIARLRRPEGARRLVEAHRELKFEPIEARVDELVVMQSQLGSAGAKYTALSRHPFG